MTKAPWQATVLTLYPHMFPGPLGQAVTGRALEANAWALQAVNIRDYAFDKHGSVDDTPYGGGAGMVMRADVVGASVEDALIQATPRQPRCVYLSPKGKPFTTALAKELASHEDGLVLLCGRFEGIDQRVLDHHNMEEISIGDYVISGGELAAMVVLDACLRYRPHVLGSAASLEEESFNHNLLEYPQYTRPVEWAGKKVPDVLQSGDHKKIDMWRHQQAEQTTQARRPDLWTAYCNEKGLEK